MASDAPRTMTVDQATELALTHHRAGRFLEALAVYDAVLAARPDHLNILYMKAQALLAMGDPAGAAAAMENAAARHPTVSALPALLAECRLQQGRDVEALESCRAALRLNGGELRAWRVAATAQERLGRPADAARSLSAALSVDPTQYDLRLRQAELARRAGRPEIARAALRALIAAAPDQPDSYARHGAAAIDDGDFAAAAADFEKGLKLRPDYVELALQLGDLHRSLCDYDGVASSSTRLAAILRASGETMRWGLLTSALYRDLFMPLPPDLIKPLQAAVDRQLTAEAAGSPLPPPLSRPPPPSVADRRAHLAFLSSNLGNHPIGQVSRSFFAHLDRRRFRLSCFSGRDHTADAGSSYGRDIAAAFDQTTQIGGMAADAAAGLMRNAEVDVLVFLDGYMDKAGLEIIARRPAPLQVYWLGHAGGLGLSAIDYLIADRIVVPPGEEGLYREAVVRLPDIYHCADRHPIATAPLSRAACGLPDDGVVFCAFNSPEKIDRRIFAVWMRILQATPGAVLWLSNPGSAAAVRAMRIKANAAAAGVDPARIVFAARLADKAEHLARHRLADLFLDTLTLNASTTALDALWAGLPVLTVLGERFSGRIAASMTAAVGQPETICADLADYEARAVALAANPAALQELKARLAASALSAPLFDAGRFAACFGAAIDKMTELRAAGRRPESFDIPSEGRART